TGGSRVHSSFALASRRVVFFFQAEDGIRDKLVTGVQTCALPILRPLELLDELDVPPVRAVQLPRVVVAVARHLRHAAVGRGKLEIGRASCRERGEIMVGAVALKKKEATAWGMPKAPSSTRMRKPI